MNSYGPSQYSSLQSLLLDAFTAAELREFLVEVFGVSILHELGSGPHRQVVHEAVLCLERQNQIDKNFFSEIARRRPKLLARIRAVSVSWHVNGEELFVARPGAPAAMRSPSIMRAVRTIGGGVGLIGLVMMLSFDLNGLNRPDALELRPEAHAEPAAGLLSLRTIPDARTVPANHKPETAPTPNTPKSSRKAPKPTGKPSLRVFVSGAVVPDGVKNEEIPALRDAATEWIRGKIAKIERCFTLDEMNSTFLCFRGSDGEKFWYAADIEFRVDAQGELHDVRVVNENSLIKPSPTCVPDALNGKVAQELGRFPGRYLVSVRDRRGFKASFSSNERTLWCRPVEG